MQVSGFCDKDVWTLWTGNADLSFVPWCADPLPALRAFEILVRFTVLPLLLQWCKTAVQLLLSIQESGILCLPFRYVSGKRAKDPQDHDDDAESVEHIVQNPKHKRGGIPSVCQTNQWQKGKENCRDQAHETDSVHKLCQSVNAVPSLHKSI